MISFIEPRMIRIQNSFSIEMIKIQRGSFLMGEKGKQKKIVITNDFALGKYPITIAEYSHFITDTDTHKPEWMKKGSNYHLNTGTDDHYAKLKLTDNMPIIGINWHDAVAYCTWLSEKTGKEYRLPTEMEWEYACRAETTTLWSFGDNRRELKKYAWYRENSHGLGKKHFSYGLHEVGKKLPNPWGLYDMHGHVWEWCEDCYNDKLNEKILCGGSWVSDDYDTFSSSRSQLDASTSLNGRGFRILKVLS